MSDAKTETPEEVIDATTPVEEVTEVAKVPVWRRIGKGTMQVIAIACVLTVGAKIVSAMTTVAEVATDVVD